MRRSAIGPTATAVADALAAFSPVVRRPRGAYSPSSSSEYAGSVSSSVAIRPSEAAVSSSSSGVGWAGSRSGVSVMRSVYPPRWHAARVHVLRAGPLTATWLPEHGMVGSSLTHRGEELLGQRGGLDAYLERGSAFGIPLLAPWANRLSGLRYGPVELDPDKVKLDANGLPKDGVMAGRAWTIERATQSGLVATFESSPPVLAVFPFPHRLRVTTTLSPVALTVTTELTATGVVPVPVAFGWHPLFTLPGAARDELDVTVPAAQESVLDARGIPTGTQQARTLTDGPLADRTADSEFPAVDGELVLRGGGRELRVRFGAPDYPVGHLWAPAAETFVAWEPMTAPTNALVSRDGLRHVVPGATFTAAFSVEVLAAAAGGRSAASG